MPADGDMGTSETALFAQALSALKRRGSSVLVVGNEHERTQLDACQRLLGDASVGPRHRVLVSTDGEMDVDRRLPAGEPDGGSTTLVDRSIKTRSAASAQPTSIGSLSTELVDGDGLGPLEEAITAAIEGIESRGPLAPAELRVGIDSLSALLADHDEEDVLSFLRAFGDEIRRVNAMGHAHLPVGYDEPIVETLAPAFDAVIELRITDGKAEQRWHLQDEGITTDWLVL